ncbi:phage tail tube protein [Microbacterium sp.]|uniref:phage tail tube protein n=1 Tax=Microbacterium sp. TaxID=51671 RepID=UPI0028117F7F|nr:phage tail tube protein [Microbacterium sp.]
MVTQADCSIAFKKETTYGTAVTVERFLEFTSETLDLDRAYHQGENMRPGTRVARSQKRILTREGAAGDITQEVQTKGFGALFELALGVASAWTEVEADSGVYQGVFTLVKDDFLPSATIQKGVPRLPTATTPGGVDAFTFAGCQVSSIEFEMSSEGVLTMTTSWIGGRAVDTSTPYVPSAGKYPQGCELFSFVDASLVLGGTITMPTATALATGGTVAGNVREASISIDQALDDNGRNLGGRGERSRPGAVGLAEITGSLTVEYDTTLITEAVLEQKGLALVLTFQGPSDIGDSGLRPVVQIVVPEIKLEGDLPKSNGGDVITHSSDFVGLDPLVPGQEPIYLVYRSADLVL